MSNIKLSNSELDLLRQYKESAYNYRKRREDDWQENYTLYRDKVLINRLIQRQSVNVPFLKGVVRTLLKDVDDMPMMFFENLDNDKQREMFQNFYWEWVLNNNMFELKDIVDKRQVLLFGRTFDQMQIKDKTISITVQDPEDMLVDRYFDPVDLDTSRYLIHTHIYVPLASLERNPDYDQEKVTELKKWHAEKQGIIKAADNTDMLQRRNQKMIDMGLTDVDDPILGETYVELNLFFVYRKESSLDEQLFLYATADDYVILMKKPLEEIIGKTSDNYWQNHFPYNSWADDLERQDFWSDGVADIVRTPNKVLNAWFSQLVENRTLRNLGMHYFDATIEGFNPQIFEPMAWGWYPVPGRPKDVLERVDIPDLSESLDEMQFVISIVEKATASTPTQQGMQTERQITLGEVQLALREAKERIKGMSKFYIWAYKKRGEKFLKLIEASPQKLKAVEIYKKGRITNDVYKREIKPKDWMTESGYTTKVWSQDEKNSRDTVALEKLNAVAVNIPDNLKLKDIYQRRLLEFAGLPINDINDIMLYEQSKQKMLAEGAITPLRQPSQPSQPIQPSQSQQIIKFQSPYANRQTT